VGECVIRLEPGRDRPGLRLTPLCVRVCQVHLNCALWSSEVYETQAGALINVELALRRSLTLRCAHCQHTGATSGCNRLRCTNTYHFTCALQAHCTFFKVRRAHVHANTQTLV